MARRHAARQLTERDRDVCHWIGQAGIAGEAQIHTRYWAGKRIQTAQDRLLQLCKAGYLERQVCDVRRPSEVVYTLTRKGRLLFDRAERERLHVGLPATHELKQQLVAQDAYIQVEAITRQAGGQLLDWRSERELRSEFRRAEQDAAAADLAAPTWEIADAQAVCVGPDGVLETLDVEIDGQYFGQMLRKKIARFGESGRPTLWVCTSSKRAGNIQKIAAAWPTIQVVIAS